MQDLMNPNDISWVTSKEARKEFLATIINRQIPANVLEEIVTNVLVTYFTPELKKNPILQQELSMFITVECLMASLEADLKVEGENVYAIAVMSPTVTDESYLHTSKVFINPEELQKMSEVSFITESGVWSIRKSYEKLAEYMESHPETKKCRKDGDGEIALTQR